MPWSGPFASCCVVGLGAWLATSTVPAQVVFDAAHDFSSTQNPNGVWSYGYEETFGSSLQTYDLATMDHRPSWPGELTLGLDWWTASQVGDEPLVIHNRTDSEVLWASTRVPARGLQLHPGPSGQCSAVRWTAPAAGRYIVNAAFHGNDFVGPTSTDVHVLQNDGSLFDDVVTAYGPGPSFSTDVGLSTGDTIEFLVGFGGNGNWGCDSTGLEATITLLLPNQAPAIITQPVSQKLLTGQTGRVNVVA